MSPGFDRPVDLHEAERLEQPSRRSTWIALALIVAILVMILLLLSIVGDFGVDRPPSSVAEIPSAK